MKRVNLIKLISNQLTVCDSLDYLEHYVCDPKRQPARVSMSSEFFPELIEKEVSPIHTVIDHGETHYISVERKVWEYLYLIENPVTAKTQELKIKSLTEKCDIQFQKRAREQREYNASKYKIRNASLLARIKWVFTGIKL